MICSVDYIRVGVNCEPCPGGSDISGAILSLVGVCVLLTIFVFVKVRRTKPVKIEKAMEGPSERSHFVGEVSFVLGFLFFFFKGHADVFVGYTSTNLIFFPPPASFLLLFNF
jgi:hypothetical protein